MNAIQSGQMQSKGQMIQQEQFVRAPMVKKFVVKEAGTGTLSKVEERNERQFDLAMLNDEDKAQLEEELQKNNEKFAFTSKYLKFRFDEEAETTFVDVIDSSTHEVIVSLPPEFLIDLSVKMKKIIGMYIDEKL